MNGYRISITRNGGELVGTVDIDGTNLESPGGRMSVIEAITEQMGGHAIAECAGQPSPQTHSGHYVIVAEDPDPLDERPVFWSNLTGWGDLASADTYSPEQRDSTRLPDRGEWITLREARSLS